LTSAELLLPFQTICIVWTLSMASTLTHAPIVNCGSASVGESGTVIKLPLGCGPGLMPLPTLPGTNWGVPAPFPVLVFSRSLALPSNGYQLTRPKGAGADAYTTTANACVPWSPMESVTVTVKL